ncbi:ROK family transcriptional regulator [Pseudonocardia sp. C8]|uniref:ROK family transcriptional regulator n=1 Tax=Pseudonocardia sp. C8 TaxID=2762759 RepID=UPI00164339E6|nr:ROK family transcriptional regulator [Pseudonocardia sp. C8]MBC3194754.1 ROK family transcriptional regulator [Pseudonocardia sp. C8]
MKDHDDSRNPGSQGALRRANRARIVAELRRGGHPSQADLARMTELAPATVSNIVRDLERDGIVVIEGTGRARRVRLDPTGGRLVAGIDYGHRHVTVALAGADGVVHAERRADLPAGLPARDGLRIATGLLDELVTAAATTVDELAAVGMGIPAPLDSRTGRVGSPTILPGWVDMPAAEVASESLGRPVVVDNDANLGALAELRWGSGAEVSNLIYVKLSEGVGAGLITDGRLFRGPSGTAGEFGHTTVDELGALCRCGNRGCLETRVAARHVVDLLRPVVGRELTIGEIVARARDGDRGCARVLADTGEEAGRAIADMCNVFNPELVAVGGELAQAGELLLVPMRRAVARRGIPGAVEGLRIATASLGAQAPVLGAVAAALDSVITIDH